MIDRPAHQEALADFLDQFPVVGLPGAERFPLRDRVEAVGLRAALEGDFDA